MKEDDAIQMIANAIGENGLADEWVFRISNKKKVLGECYYDAKRIEISRHLIEHNDADAVMDVVLHEIAHALAGPGTGHGELWKAYVRQLGARPERLNRTAELAPANWYGYCPHGKQVEVRYRRPRHLNYVCRCGGTTLKDALVWVIVKEGKAVTVNESPRRRQAALNAARRDFPGLDCKLQIVI